MNEKKVSAYRRIVSSTAVFGSAQVLNVLVNIIRGKLVAYILHSTGMGLSTIFSQAANTIQQFSLMGLNIAAVPSISQADSDKNEMILAYAIRIVKGAGRAAAEAERAAREAEKAARRKK